MNTKIENTSELLRLRRTLQSISDISFSFSTLNRQFPLSEIDNENTQALIEEYRRLIEKVGIIYHEYEEENERDK